MLGKLFNLVSLTAISTLLALGGVATYAVKAGHLNADRAQLIAEVLRGEHDDLSAPPEEEPPPPEPNEPIFTGGDSNAAVRETLAKKQLFDAELERAMSNMTARQRLLDQAAHELIQQQEQFEQAKQAWLDQRKQMRKADLDEGFKRELEYVEKLEPRQAKDHLLRTWEKHPADAVRLVRRLPTRTGQRILSELKTDEELKVMHELLERLRLMDVEDALKSRTTAGDADV